MIDSVGSAKELDALAHQELAAQFCLEVCISRGATAAKYFAREHGSNRAVVVKVLPRPAGDPAADERFRLAVSVASTLELHSTPVLSSGSTEHLYWYTTDRSGERSVRTAFLSLGPVVVKARHRIASQMASALGQLRRHGFERGDTLGADNGQGNGRQEPGLAVGEERPQAAAGGPAGPQLDAFGTAGGLERDVRGAAPVGGQPRAPRQPDAGTSAGPGPRPGDEEREPAPVVAAAAGAEPADELARKELTARFHLDACISREADMTAYLAREQGSDRAVIVRVMPRPAEGREAEDARFRGIVAAVMARGHPQSKPVLDSGWTEHVYWYSMEQVPERSARNWIHRLRQRASWAWQWIVARLAAALDRWHALGVGARLHRRFLALGPVIVRTRQWLGARMASALDRWHALGVGRWLRGRLRPLGPASARAWRWIVARVDRTLERWRSLGLGRWLRERLAALRPVMARVWRWVVALAARARDRWRSLGLGRWLRERVIALRPVVARAWRWIVELVASGLDRWHSMRLGRWARERYHALGIAGRRGRDRDVDDAWDEDEGEPGLVRADGRAPDTAAAKGGDLPDEFGWAGGSRRDATGQGRSEEQSAPDQRRGAGSVGAGPGGRDRAPVLGGVGMRGDVEGVAAICPNCGAGQISPLTQRCELCGFAPGGSGMEGLAREELAEEFRLGALLGRGRTTAVFVARTHESEREIAVKVLPRPARQRADADERFKRAVEAVAALEHPHIVPVFDHGWTESLYWYSMDHVRGRSLRNYLVERAPLDLKACLRVTAQVASALDHAHRRGVVHGFLKPENVLIDAEGWVHLCDLLVTRALEPPPAPAPPMAAPDPEGAAAGPAPSPHPDEEDRSPYSAPEGLCTPSADQYALAVMVAECLSAVPRLEALPPGVPPHVRNAAERALSPMPMDRFGGVLEFVAALETYATPALETRPSGRSSGVLRVGEWKAPQRPGRTRLMRAGALAAAVLAIVVWQRSSVLRVFHRSGAPTQLVPVAPMVTDSEPLVAQRLRAEALRALGRGTGLPPARTTAPTPVSTEPGKLFVSATPWGQLYIDGQLVGNTPKANVPLATGLHAIRVLREGYEPFDRIVRVEAGQTVRLTDITLVQRP